MLWGGECSQACKYILKTYSIDISDTSDKNLDGFASERIDDGLNGWVVWIKDSKDFSTLAHEVIHLVYNIFAFKNIDIKVSEEVFAYYHAFWFKKIKDILNYKY